MKKNQKRIQLNSNQLQFQDLGGFWTLAHWDIGQMKVGQPDLVDSMWPNKKSTIVGNNETITYADHTAHFGEHSTNKFIFFRTRPVSPVLAHSHVHVTNKSSHHCIELTFYFHIFGIKSLQITNSIQLLIIIHLIKSLNMIYFNQITKNY